MEEGLLDPKLDLSLKFLEILFLMRAMTILTTRSEATNF